MGRLRECREKANLSQKYVDQKKKPKNAVFLGYFYEMTFNYYFIRGICTTILTATHGYFSLLRFYYKCGRFWG